LLQALGLPFVVIGPEQVDETPLANEAPSELVQRLSRLKAEAVMRQLHPNLAALQQSPKYFIIIAADTEVTFQNKILGKPANPAEATTMLQQMRTECHYVYSGLTVARLAAAALTLPAPQRIQQAVCITQLHQSTVWMRAYTDEEIAAYVASGDPLDKAGGYGIQHPEFTPVARLEGCYASVMGLPLAELALALQALGVTVPNVETCCTRYIGTPCCQSV
jgi:septum formation protein